MNLVIMLLPKFLTTGIASNPQAIPIHWLSPQKTNVCSACICIIVISANHTTIQMCLLSQRNLCFLLPTYSTLECPLKDRVDEADNVQTNRCPQTFINSTLQKQNIFQYRAYLPIRKAIFHCQYRIANRIKTSNYATSAKYTFQRV